MITVRGGSRNYRIRAGGWGGRPSLTDVLVVLYLLLQIDHSKGTNISKEGGGVHF